MAFALCRLAPSRARLCASWGGRQPLRLRHTTFQGLFRLLLGYCAHRSRTGSAKRADCALSAFPGFVFRVAELLQVAAIALGLAGDADLPPMMNDLVRKADPAVLGQHL